MAVCPEARSLELRAIVLPFLLAFLVAAAGAQSSEALRAYRAGRLAEALSLSLEALRLRPSDADASAVLGWCYLDSGKWEDAHRVAARAFKTARYDHRLLDILARASFALGLNEESLQHFQDYITLVPEGAATGKAYAYMGEIFVRQGRYQRADIAFTTAVSHSPGDAGLWSRLGYAREMAKDYVHSRAAYEQALRLNPALHDATLGLERVQERATSR